MGQVTRDWLWIDLTDWPRDTPELLFRLTRYWAQSTWLVCNRPIEIRTLAERN
jgi:hypothetical protein